MQSLSSKNDLERFVIIFFPFSFKTICTPSFPENSIPSSSHTCSPSGTESINAANSPYGRLLTQTDFKFL